MPEGTVSVPVLDDGVLGTWRAEGSTVGEETPTFRRVTLRARTCAVKVRISNELLEDAGPQALQTIEDDIAKALALRIDYAALRGAGTDHEPLGLRFTNGVTITPITSGGGPVTDFDFISDAMTAVETANATPTGLLWHPRTAGQVRKLVESTTGQPLKAPAAVEQLAKHPTTQIPVDLADVGTSDEQTEVYVGDWRHLLVGVRPGLGVRLLVSPHTDLDTLETSIVAWVRADIAVVHPDAFHITNGITAS